MGNNLVYVSSISLFMVVHYCFIACLGKPLNSITDQQALLALKAHMITNHDEYPYTKNPLTNNWTIGTNMCSWIGISCSVRHQRVTSLTLPNLSLLGTIPPHIGNLSFLSFLNLRNNSFQGHLPTEVGHLRRLKFIGLEFNNFTGEIPTSLGTLPSLQHLLLMNNSFTGNIPLSLFNISNLENLTLGGNLLEGKIPEEIGNLGNLRLLSTLRNKFTGSIPTSLFNISSLENIDLRFSGMSGGLPLGMCDKLSSLEGLFLSYNQISGPIPSNIARCGKLRTIALSFNRLAGSIPTSIGNLTMLKGLFLAGNMFTGEIPQEISNLRNMERLDVSNAGNFGRIPPSIFNITSLKGLYLMGNNIRGVMPLEVGNLVNIEELVLQMNELRGPIPATIFNISTLRLLSLAGNQLSGNLPSTIGHELPNLVELNLGGNNLSGIIPTSISNASKLINLNLILNAFSGTIPNSLGNLERLRFLRIGGNNLTSEISSTGELGFLSSLANNCRHLRVLWISETPLNGVLPVSIGNFSTSLEEIDANGSGIKGSIPDEMGNLTNLAFLRVNNNELTGFLPATFKGLQKLQILALANNKIQGFIPNDLCSLPNLGGIHMPENELSGPIPSCLGNISSLRYLRLGSNRLTTNIPPTLWNLKDLLQFSSYSNSLSGNLPHEVGNLKAAVMIDLSMNQLTFHIPSSIGLLENLQHLHLGYNRFEGPIPESFGSMLSLEFLDLSHNDLSGSIPKSLKALSHLKYFNISFNKLEGEIPSRGPFANFTNESFFPNGALCGAPQLQLPPCATITQSRSGKKRVLLRTLLPIASILVVLTLALLFIRSRSGRKIPIQNDLVLAKTIHERISYHELLRATSGFSESNMLGMGSFGSVFKGMLIDGVSVAVKVFNLQQEGAFRSFDTECEMLRNIRHRNLTKVISSCSNLDFKALVLEFMPNGNLDKWLYSHNHFLDMLQRLDIMIDVACALDYLHHGYSTPVVHCDIKPSNILLDENMVAHVSDFGIAKLLGEEESIAHTKTIATLGYIAPEYGLEGSISTRCDVYSYGILLMETFTRTKPIDERFAGDLSLKGWVNESLPNSMFEVIDTNLISPEEQHCTPKLQCVAAIMELSLNCSAELPHDRINMKDALVALQKIRRQFLANQAGT